MNNREVLKRLDQLELTLTVALKGFEQDNINLESALIEEVGLFKHHIDESLAGIETRLKRAIDVSNQAAGWIADAEKEGKVISMIKEDAKEG